MKVVVELDRADPARWPGRSPRRSSCSASGDDSARRTPRRRPRGPGRARAAAPGHRGPATSPCRPRCRAGRGLPLGEVLVVAQHDDRTLPRRSDQQRLPKDEPLVDVGPAATAARGPDSTNALAPAPGPPARDALRGPAPAGRTAPGGRRSASSSARPDQGRLDEVLGIGVAPGQEVRRPQQRQHAGRARTPRSPAGHADGTCASTAKVAAPASEDDDGTGAPDQAEGRAARVAMWPRRPRTGERVLGQDDRADRLNGIRRSTWPVSTSTETMPRSLSSTVPSCASDDVCLVAPAEQLVDRRVLGSGDVLESGRARRVDGAAQAADDDRLGLVLDSPSASVSRSARMSRCRTRGDEDPSLRGRASTWTRALSPFSRRRREWSPPCCMTVAAPLGAEVEHVREVFVAALEHLVHAGIGIPRHDLGEAWSPSRTSAVPAQVSCHTSNRNVSPAHCMVVGDSPCSSEGSRRPSRRRRSRPAPITVWISSMNMMAFSCASSSLMTCFRRSSKSPR